MSRTEIDLGLGVLDHQLVDEDGRRCGKVDDLELEGVADGSPRVREIVAGPSAWRGRGWAGRVAGALVRSPAVHVPWDAVEKIEAAVRLRGRAAELRLGRGDDWARRWIERLPGAR
jgi:sporulation protein YlmC with PRC-barrel domain